jgi:hypothetical protein
MKDYENEADFEIESALATYSSAEPRPGLENRILRRAFAEDAGRRFTFAGWAWALAVSAGLLIGIVEWNQPRTETHPVARQEPTRLPAPAGTQQAPAETRLNIRNVPKAVPRQAVFPVATPLTSEERAMVAFVNHALWEDVNALIEASERPSAPLQVEDIVIAPLQSDDGNRSEP